MLPEPCLVALALLWDPRCPLFKGQGPSPQVKLAPPSTRKDWPLM